MHLLRARPSGAPPRASQEGGAGSVVEEVGELRTADAPWVVELAAWEKQAAMRQQQEARGQVAAPQVRVGDWL